MTAAPLEPRCVSTCRRRSLAENQKGLHPCGAVARTRHCGCVAPSRQVLATIGRLARSDPSHRATPTHYDAANKPAGVAVLHCLRRSSSDYLPSFLQQQALPSRLASNSKSTYRRKNTAVVKLARSRPARGGVVARDQSPWLPCNAPVIAVRGDYPR